jgi:hypothetical protein
MNLTNFQIEAVNFIISQGQTEIHLIVEKYLNQNQTEEIREIIRNYDQNCNNASSVPPFYVVTSEEEAINKLSSFYGLWQFLKKEDLIFEVDYESAISNPLQILNSDLRLCIEATRIFNLMRKKFIISSPELISFKDRGYMTKNEYDRIKNDKHLKNSMFWTKFTAVASISISIVLAIGTTYFNYRTFSNERKVEITKMPESDTIKTFIIPYTSVKK